MTVAYCVLCFVQPSFEAKPAPSRVSAVDGHIHFHGKKVSGWWNPYTNTNKEKIGSFFPRALAYVVNDFPR